jgi:hypothetical protein
VPTLPELIGGSPTGGGPKSQPATTASTHPAATPPTIRPTRSMATPAMKRKPQRTRPTRSDSARRRVQVQKGKVTRIGLGGQIGGARDRRCLDVTFARIAAARHYFSSWEYQKTSIALFWSLSTSSVDWLMKTTTGWSAATSPWSLASPADFSGFPRAWLTSEMLRL